MTRPISAVILAAGNGQRLKGIAATGMKPLIPVNGVPLIKAAVHQASMVTDDIVVVVSPNNAAPICELCGCDVTYVVQPEARGPGEALLRGLRATLSRRTDVLLLMGDNYMAPGTVAEFVAKAVNFKMAIGTKDVGYTEVKRFTRVRIARDKGMIESEEGPTIGWPAPWTVWCGPILAPKRELARAIIEGHKHKTGEQKIGPYLGDVNVPTLLAHTDVHDIGVPEALI